MSKNWSWKWTELSNHQKLARSDCLKTLFMLSTFPMMIQISGKCGHFAQKFYFYQKITNKQS